MRPSPTLDREPFFMGCRGRRLFAIYYPPGQNLENRGGAVFFAPFAEELNRTRRMATLLAEALAAAGIGTLVFDYSGTGDSDGRFGEADWDAWVEDGVAAIDWLSQRTDGPVMPVGLRLGSAIALHCARRAPQRIDRAVLWQPVTSGQMMLTQFMRVRIAAAMAGAAERETTATLRDRLEVGETLEIAGYDLSPGLARTIGSIRLAHCAPPPTVAIHWFEVAAEESGGLLPASEPVVAAWRQGGIAVSASTVSGEPFWTTQEIATAPSLVDATVRALTGSGA